MQPLTSLGHRAGQNQLFTGTTTLVSLPMTENPFFRNRRGYCCTNACVERSFMLEGLAGQAASTGPRTGSCCCSCCRSAISVGEARWPDSLELPQCRTAPLHCPSASLTAPLHCLPVPPDSSSTLSPGRCDSSTSNPDRSTSFCRGVEGRQVGSMDEEPQVRGCYNITFICTPTNQETV